MIKLKWVLFFLCLLSISGCSSNDTLSQIVYQDDKMIRVNIDGHVNNPGWITVDKKASLDQLIKLAKGYKPNAVKLNNIELKDKMYLFVYSDRIKDKINLNNASTTELMKVKGIGPKLAEKIMDYRVKFHGFKKMSELKDIKGIKDKLYQKIYEYFIL